jgi:hypothetical protein
MAPSQAAPDKPGRIPLWLKAGCTLFAAVTFPSYYAYYGFAHAFLWFSDIALLLTCIALWRESPLLASTQAVGVVLIELTYTLDFAVRLTTGTFLTGLSVYFFQGEDSPFWVRSLSLFHIPLPFLLLWLLWKLGYDRRAWWVQTALAWVLLPVCYFFTNSADNVNWVFGPRGTGWDWMPEWGWLVLLMIGFPLLVYLPSHAVFRKVFPEPSRPRPRGRL